MLLKIKTICVCTKQGFESPSINFYKQDAKFITLAGCGGSSSGSLSDYILSGPEYEPSSGAGLFYLSIFQQCILDRSLEEVQHN